MLIERTDRRVQEIEGRKMENIAELRELRLREQRGRTGETRAVRLQSTGTKTQRRESVRIRNRQIEKKIRCMVIGVKVRVAL